MFGTKAIIAAATLLLVTPACAEDLLIGRLEQGDPLTEALQFYDDWTFRGTAGQTLLFSIRSPSFIPRVLVLPPPASKGRSYDSLGGKQPDNYGITVSLPIHDTGTWTLRVTEDTTVGGDYSIELDVH